MGKCTEFFGDVVLPVARTRVRLLHGSPCIRAQPLSESAFLVGQAEVHAVGQSPVIRGVARVDGVSVDKHTIWLYSKVRI